MSGRSSKVKLAANSKRWAQAHRDRMHAAWSRWYVRVRRDPEWLKRRAASKHATYLRTKAKRLAASQRWADANRDRMRAAQKKFRQAHRVSERARCAAKARLRANRITTTTIGKVDYVAIVRASNGKCGICKQTVRNGPAHIDHIIPLARGGSHTQDNLQLAHARCNLLKGASVLKVG